MRNTPKAPEMISSPPRRDHPVRPTRKARRYSTTWMRGSHRFGIRTRVTRPREMSEPLATRTTPPEATTRSGSSANGRETCSRASGSSSESASTMQTSCLRAALMPTLSASALPPLVLRTRTTLLLPRRLRWVEVTCPVVAMSTGTTIGTSTMSKASISCCDVSSLDPSSMTTTSKSG